MNKAKRLIVSLLLVVFAVIGASLFTACGGITINPGESGGINVEFESSANGGNEHSSTEGGRLTILNVPTYLRIEDGFLYWNPVEYCSGYTVSVDGKEYVINENEYSLDGIADGTHKFKVKANGDGQKYASSDFSDE